MEATPTMYSAPTTSPKARKNSKLWSMEKSKVKSTSQMRTMPS